MHQNNFLVWSVLSHITFSLHLSQFPNTFFPGKCKKINHLTYPSELLKFFYPLLAMNNPNPNQQSSKTNKAKNRKTTKGSNSSKKKQGGIKVVYISNPMKVSTSASQFRALVQELTGQDSAFPADPARFSAVYSSSPNSSFIGEALPDSTVQNHHHLHDYALDLEVASSPTSYQEQAAGSSNSNDSKNQHEIELYDDLFVPEMVDNLGGLLPSTVMYGSSS